MKKKTLTMLLAALLILMMTACHAEKETIYDDINDGQETTAVGEFQYEVADPDYEDISSCYSITLNEDGSGYWMYPEGDGTSGTFIDKNVTWDEKAVYDEEGNEYPYTVSADENGMKTLNIDGCDYTQVINGDDFSDSGADVMEPADMGDNSVSVVFGDPNSENSFSMIEETDYGYKITQGGSMTQGIICEDMYVKYDKASAGFEFVCEKNDDEDQAEFEQELDNVKFYINNSEEGYKYDEIKNFKEGDNVYNMFFPNGVIIPEE